MSILPDSNVLFYSGNQCYQRKGSLQLQLQTELTTSAMLKHCLCLLNVPSFMIPNGIIQFFSCYRSSILSIRILRHYHQQEDYLAVLTMESAEAAQIIITDFHGKPLSSLDPILCMLVSFFKIYTLCCVYTKK